MLKCILKIYKFLVSIKDAGSVCGLILDHAQDLGGYEARSWPRSRGKEARSWPRSRGKEARSWPRSSYSRFFHWVCRMCVSVCACVELRLSSLNLLLPQEYIALPSVRFLMYAVGEGIMTVNNKLCN